MQRKRQEISAEEKQHLDLLQDIAKTKCALDCAYSNFDNVTEPDLIDCYIYEVNAVQKRYKFLLEKASKLNMLTSDLYSETP